MWSKRGMFRVFIAISGAYCVLMGAWLSHGATFLTEAQHTSMATALHYQFIHTITLLSLYVWYNLAPQKSLLLTIVLFMIGITLFSGSIYLKTLTPYAVVGQLAPLGGITLALAWISLVFQRSKS